MTTRIATVPATPLLIPEVAAGAAAEFHDVRGAALQRVRWAAGSDNRVILLAADPGVRSVVELPASSSLDLSGLGLPTSSDAATRDSSGTRPVVSAMVGNWLAAAVEVEIASIWAVPADPAQALAHPTPDLGQGDVGVVLIADGSATRTPKAPGSFVEGALEFDDRLTDAVSAVDVDYFLDPARVDDVERFGVQGLGAWAVAARFARTQTGEWSGEVDLAADPLGVQYLVAGWRQEP